VRAVFREPFELDEGSVALGASVGGGVWPADGRTITELVRYADAAMYQDKARARSAYGPRDATSSRSGITPLAHR
jgi:GGDEF domain-containing protein